MNLTEAAGRYRAVAALLEEHPPLIGADEKGHNAAAVRRGHRGRTRTHHQEGPVTAGVQAAIRCEHDGCHAYHRGPHWHPAGDPGQAVLEARMSAQAEGWATRRNHGGRDLCPAHRIEAAA